MPELFGWQEQPLAFDVALHIGTTLAVVAYFYHDWWILIRASASDLRRWGPRVQRWGPYSHLALLIAAGTVPAVVAGALLAGVEERLRTAGVVAAMLVLVGAYMAAAERWAAGAKEPGVERLTWTGALVIGVAQTCALVPGVSRSGATIATGMFTGLSRAAAARFSFLMATPVTVAAMVLELPGLRHAEAQGITRLEIAAGILASLVVGVGAIRFLLRYLGGRSLYPFVLYRLALAVVVVFVVIR